MEVLCAHRPLLQGPSPCAGHLLGSFGPPRPCLPPFLSSLVQPSAQHHLGWEALALLLRPWWETLSLSKDRSHSPNRGPR